MDIEEHVSTPAQKSKKRRGYALASAVALIFFLTVILGVAISHLDYSSEVMDAWQGRLRARNTLESLTSMSLKWLSARVNAGVKDREQAIIGMEHLTDCESLRIFASNDYNGCEVEIYYLGYAADKITGSADASRMFPPGFPGGYMIRATSKKGLTPLTVESVYAVTLITVPGGSTIEILDSKPLYSRELFR